MPAPTVHCAGPGSPSATASQRADWPTPVHTNMYKSNYSVSMHDVRSRSINLIVPRSCKSASTSTTKRMAICMHVDAYVFTCRMAFMKHVFPKFGSPGQRPVQQAWPDELRKLCMHIHMLVLVYIIFTRTYALPLFLNHWSGPHST